MNYFKIYTSNHHFFPQHFSHEIQFFFNYYLCVYSIFTLQAGATNGYFNFIFLKAYV